MPCLNGKSLDYLKRNTMQSPKNSLFDTKTYKELVIKNNYNTLEYLLKEGVEFAIVSYTETIDFNPAIPKDIIEFDKLALFIIANYSFESAVLEKEFFSFEAGFGNENFGSLLTIPLDAIAQIIVGEDVLAISHYEPKKEQESTVNSMDILLNNPENLKLLKKKRGNKK